ncbi:MAG: alanine--tRNA ligase [Deltaproteobacteria bacterium]|nr:alanine--tRNA ligase [Deltaproteobacteria bacterium]
MKPLSTDQIRALFLQFFKERGHEVVTSSPLVPDNDPTLLFTNAGMVQFKDVFTGKEKRGYSRATTAQKCVRAGGKHNDLENVGYTARHHTFFEMLGNFSFGDYFKEDAIRFAWELCTEVLGLPKERLSVTVFKGEDGIPADDEAARLWEQAGVAKDRIFRLGKGDNYWQMGDTGPQGPCSEIHYYLGDLGDPGYLTEARVAASQGWLEIWNLVFMQFHKEKPDSPLLPLPKPSIDTGAGLERLAFVLQGTASNYETDAFLPLIEGVAKELGKRYGGFGTDHPDDVSMRVIADHSRAASFLIADGVQPSNEGRGYVLRRIMRRAIRHGSRLGFDDLFFQRACLRVIDRMKGTYPELERARALITKVAENEETSFRRTLDRGLKLLSDAMSGAKDRRQDALDPGFVAKLYHTYGFPIDLTRVIAGENSLAVDEAAAQQAVVDSNPEQASAQLTSEQGIDRVWYDVRDRAGPSTFLGYQRDDAQGVVKAIVLKGHAVEQAQAGDEVSVVLDQTPFYGESGGQVGDCGLIEWKGLRVRVRDTQKPRPDLTVHIGKVEEGTIRVGQAVETQIDRAAREATRKNHSATHLLHLALKEILGDHVQQKGSLVAPDRLRFDYAHFEPVTVDQIEAIERRVNAMVLEDAETITEVGSIERAKAAGAVMLFGEKYGDQVRMVRIGQESLELCGGTHVRRAGEIGLFKITSDGALAAGVRRLEAVTGLGALALVQHQGRVLHQAVALVKTQVDALPDRIEKLIKRAKELERELDKAKAQAALGAGTQGGDLLDRAETIRGIRVLIHRADGTPAKALREMSDKLRDRLQSGVVVLGTVEEEKASILVAVTKDIAGKAAHAGDLVKVAAQAMSGSGGGRPDFAQGGGRADLLDQGLARLRDALQG